MHRSYYFKVYVIPTIYMATLTRDGAMGSLN